MEKNAVYDEGVNLLEQDFTTTNIHEKWVADITLFIQNIMGGLIWRVWKIYTRGRLSVQR